MKKNNDLINLSKLSKNAICKQIAKEVIVNIKKIYKLKKKLHFENTNEKLIHINKLYYNSYKNEIIKKKELYYKIPNMYIKKNA